MAQVVDDEIWACVDCLMIVANDDASGMDDETEAKCRAGVSKFDGYLVCNFGSDEDSEEGIREFSSCGCDVCGSPLAGTFHRLALLK
jgi:hypothetical protein